MKKRKRLLQKKDHFFFGSEQHIKAKLVFMRRHSNFFLTLLDMSDKVISCKTSGCHSFCLNKKRKTSLQAVESVCSLLLPFLKMYNISAVGLVFRNLDEDICYRLFDYLLSKGIKVTELTFLMRNAHNGVRGRKIRRI
jgi:ribosomal protein S11